jgi:MtN3 and saliva related transmembrane protein
MNMIEFPELQYLATLAGTIGGILSVGAFLPQALRIVRRRSAADVSLTMYLAIIAASVLWMFYAYFYGAVELFVTNLVIGVIAIVIAMLRIRYGGQ